MRHGDIHWAEPDPSVGREQAGHRPVLIVSSNDALDAITQVVTTIPLTTRARGWATHIPVAGDTTGLPHPTWALCEQVRTISTHRLRSRVGAAETATLDSVAGVLRYLLNLS